jgi:hypothetical protein
LIKCGKKNAGRNYDFVFLVIKIEIMDINEITKITKKKVLTRALNIYQILPIILLTNKFYVSRYGAYSVKYDMEYVANFFLLPNPYIASATFIILVGFIYALERVLIPLIVIMFYKSSFPKDEFKTSKVYANNLSKTLLGFNPLVYFKSLPSFTKKDLYLPFISFTMATVLWLIYISTVYSYIMIILVFFLFFALIKVLNSIYKYH